MFGCIRKRPGLAKKPTYSSQIPSKLKMVLTSGTSSLLEPASAMATSGIRERKRKEREGKEIEGWMKKRQEKTACLKKAKASCGFNGCRQLEFKCMRVH